MAWIPTDVNEIHTVNSELASRSSQAYIYLMLLTRIFGQIDLNNHPPQYSSRDQDAEGSQYSEFIFELEKHNETAKLNDKSNDVENNLDAAANSKNIRSIREAKKEEEVGARSAGNMLAGRLSDVEHWEGLPISKMSENNQNVEAEVRQYYTLDNNRIVRRLPWWTYQLFTDVNCDHKICKYGATN